MSSRADAARKTANDVPFKPAGPGMVVIRNCWGHAGNCGPRSILGGTYPNNRFYCQACTAARMARRISLEAA